MIQINLNQRFVAAGKFLHMPVLHHITVTNEAHYLFADERLLYPFLHIGKNTRSVDFMRSE
jgi:hypothetical protein